jgi:hypothetical protein
MPTTDIASLPPFQYKPLPDTKGTRVLVLHPGSDNDKISCHLEPVSLTTDSDFEALSYVWGDTLQREAIRCGDGRVDIKINLHSALHHLRLADRQRRIWADALCINQEDLRERNSQVKNMGRIYKNASRTLVWLGEETQAVAGAFNAFQIALKIFPPRDALQLPSQQAINELILGILDLRAATDWDSMIELLLHPWFGRKWIIQEAVLAKSVLAVCGLHTLDWNVIERVLIDIRLYHVDIVIPAITMRSNAVFAINNVMKMFFIKSGSTQRSYEELLFATFGFRSTDPRDQFFAIFGLAEDAETISPDLHPDYSVTFSQLTIGYVQWSLQCRKSLNFLVHAGDSVRVPDHNLPSWCPDFAKADSYYEHPRFLSRHNASKGSELGARIDAAEKQLHISGKLFDEVQAHTQTFNTTTQKISEKLATDPSWGEDFESANLFYRMRWVRECKSVASDDSGTLSAARNASLARSLVWDLDSQRTRAPKDFPEQINRYLDMVGELADLKEHGQEVDRDKAWWAEFLCLSSLVETPIATNSQFRRFCRTTAGSLGSVPV